MLLIIRTFLIMYGVIALGTGFMAMGAPFHSSTTSPMQDNNHRFLAAFWASMSAAFFYVACNPSETALFRFLMIAVFVGGLARISALRHYTASAFIVFGILIELIPTSLIVWMHTALLSSGEL
jgi:hypothetical protein